MSGGGSGAVSRLIGSKISVVSQGNIRYEGILSHIGQPEGSADLCISLVNVRSFGTENRPARNNIPIPPNSQMFPSVVFKKSDIKDLKVIQSPPKSATASTGGVTKQPPAGQQRSMPTNGHQQRPPYPQYGYMSQQPHYNYGQQQMPYGGYSMFGQRNSQWGQMPFAGQMPGAMHQQRAQWQQQQQRQQQHASRSGTWPTQVPTQVPTQDSTRAPTQVPSRKVPGPTATESSAKPAPTSQTSYAKKSSTAWPTGKPPQWNKDTKAETVTGNSQWTRNTKAETAVKTEQRKNRSIGQKKTNGATTRPSQSSSSSRKENVAKKSNKTKTTSRTFDKNEDFDFASSTKAMSTSGTSEAPQKKAYDKNLSFFDNISCGALDKLESMKGGKKSSTSRYQRRVESNELNMETFGETGYKKDGYGSRSHGNNNSGRRNGRRAYSKQRLGRSDKERNWRRK